MKKFNWVVWVGMFLLIVGMGLFFWYKVPNIAYVDLGKLYNEFEMKKEMENKVTIVQQQRKRIIDSMEVELNALSRNIKGISDIKEREEKIRQFEAGRDAYMYKQKAFEQDNTTMAQQFDGQIWKQLNQYVEEYGKLHFYDYLLGLDGAGGVMYGDKKNDITEDVKAFVNEKYKGNTKVDK